MEKLVSMPKFLELKSFLDYDNREKYFIKLPSGLYISKKRTLPNSTWFEANHQLQEKGFNMPTIPEFLEFLEYIKENNPEVHEEVTGIRSPWRAEWLDADFNILYGELNINSRHFSYNGELITIKSEPLNETTLPENCLNIRGDNNSVARFVTDEVHSGLCVDGYPSNRYEDLGVRAVRHGFE